MNLNRLKRILELMNEYGLSEVELSGPLRRLVVRRGINPAGAQTPTAVVPQTAAQLAPQKAEGEPAGVAGGAVVEEKLPAGVEVSPDRMLEIKAPMVGTFYRAPAPDAEPYVEEGGRVGKGDVVCIIEAMKLMNEIESEFNGIIREIHVENAQPVEYGQLLITVEAG